jgi:hypothetical protein
MNSAKESFSTFMTFVLRRDRTGGPDVGFSFFFADFCGGSDFYRSGLAAVGREGQASFLGDVDGVPAHRPDVSVLTEILAMPSIPARELAKPTLPPGGTKGKAAMIRYSKCSNILIDGNVYTEGFLGLTWFPSAAGKAARDRYEACIVGQLDMLAMRRTGWAVLKDIFDTGKARGKEVRIVPFALKDEKVFGEENAFARPTSAPGAAPRGVKLYRSDDSTKPGDKGTRLASYTGTGAGSDVEIHYSPWKLQQGPLPVCPRDGTTSRGPCRLTPGSDDTPDTTLLHELVHGLRDMRGQQNTVPTLQKGYDNEEEFFAILVANIYMSEQGKKNLRQDHQGKSRLDPALATSEGFLGKGASPPSRELLENRRLVQKFVCENFGLSGNLRSVANAAFNPVREFMGNAQLYPLYP